jgi:hypothetical protein
MLIVWLLPLLLKIVTADPIGNAVTEFAGITKPPADVRRMCLPISDSVSV